MLFTIPRMGSPLDAATWNQTNFSASKNNIIMVILFVAICPFTRLLIYDALVVAQS